MKSPKSFQFSFFISIGLFLFSLNSCKHKESKELHPSFQIPETRDTFKLEITEYLYEFQKLRGDTTNIYKNYFFEPHFFGKEKQMFYPKENIIYREVNYGYLPNFPDISIIQNKDFKKNFDYNHILNKYVIPSSGQLSFQVDFKNTKNHFIPVFIKNNCFDTLNIGFGDYLDIDVLVLNDKKEWIQIDQDYRYYCGTGQAKILLQRRQILLTYLPELKKGNFKTQFRLRLRNAYSESYPVSIDESILENIEN